jgi:G:T-mismatch repair DNA endonuclease (very short patch repair protein)
MTVHSTDGYRERKAKARSRAAGRKTKRSSGDATNLVHMKSLGFRVLVLWECECRRIEPCLVKIYAFFARVKA